MNKSTKKILDDVDEIKVESDEDQRKTSYMGPANRPEYLALTKERRLTLFHGKRKFLWLSFRLFMRWDRYQWLGLEFNSYPHGDNCDSYLNLTLLSTLFEIGIHRSTYDKSVCSGD